MGAMLVEKRRELSPFPRSRLVNVRSMEIFRQLGLEAEIAGAAFAPEYGRIRFRDTLLHRDFATAAMVGVNAPIPESPVIGAVTSQDRLEPTLLAAADSELRFGVELIDLTEDDDGIVASLVEHGEETRIRCRYMLAADGANSTVRQRLGVGTTGPGAMAAVTTVVFDADLSSWCARQPAGVYFTMHGSFLPLYPEGGWAWFAPTPGDVAGADWGQLVSRALGADVPVEVLRVQHWEIDAFMADRFRHGRILLAGDAAHAMPIMGGLGMNTGIADVHNLCWKLAGVLRGWAAPSLLESYETERHPIAERTLFQAVANTKLAFQVQNHRRDQHQTGDAPPAELEIPWSDRYFAQLGLVLGVTYNSAAVLAEGGTRDDDPGTDYVPTTDPGRRMPHFWLAEDRSTLDAVGEWFTLLTPDPAQWQLPVRWPLHIEPLPPEHAARGTVLVRPDGHVGARWLDRPADSALQHALSAITGSTGS